MQKIKPNSKKMESPNFLRIDFKIQLPFKDFRLFQDRAELYDSRESEDLNGTKNYSFDFEISQKMEKLNYYHLFLNYPSNIDQSYVDCINDLTFEKLFFEGFSGKQKGLLFTFSIIYLKPKYKINCGIRSFPNYIPFYLPSKIEIENPFLCYNFLGDEISIEINLNENVSFSYPKFININQEIIINKQLSDKSSHDSKMRYTFQKKDQNK